MLGLNTATNTKRKHCGLDATFCFQFALHFSSFPLGELSQFLIQHHIPLYTLVATSNLQQPHASQLQSIHFSLVTTGH